MEILIGILLYFVIRCVLAGFYTIDQNERAVLTTFGRAQRLGNQTTKDLAIALSLNEDEKTRYDFPVVTIVGPGLHFKMPWQRVYRTSIATETLNLAFDPQSPSANHNGTMLDAVTQDQLNIGLKGQIRYRIAEQNLYAYFFGIKNPVVHVMGYLVSVLREKIANFESQTKLASAAAHQSGEIHISESISINDLRKNLRDINDEMLKECQSTAARYGVHLDASLITGIEPPHEVESALAAINTAYNNVSSEISLAKASADQTIVLSRRAVEIETLKVQAEVEPLIALARQLRELKRLGPHILDAFVRNVRLGLFQKAKSVIVEK